MSYSIFLHSPISSLAFATLILAFISLWIHRSPWLWGSFIVLSLVFGIAGRCIDLKGCIALALLCIAHIALTARWQGKTRLILVVVAAGISGAFLMHAVPGFHNWLIAKGSISRGGAPYTFYINFDKPFIGLFPLALTIPLSSKMRARSTVLKTLLFTLAGTVLLIFLAFSFRFIALDCKLPALTPLWLVVNLFLVTIPEEAFFRGFLQREIESSLKSRWGGVFSVVFVSLIFALIHFCLFPSLPYLCLTLSASIIYGTIYQVTRSIESSIFCHYFFNVIHFFFFTYPALAT